MKVELDVVNNVLYTDNDIVPLKNILLVELSSFSDKDRWVLSIKCVTASGSYGQVYIDIPSDDYSYHQPFRDYTKSMKKSLYDQISKQLFHDTFNKPQELELKDENERVN